MPVGSLTRARIEQFVDDYRGQNQPLALAPGTVGGTSAGWTPSFRGLLNESASASGNRGNSTADKDTFINDVKAETQRRDAGRQHTWVIVSDGERALQHRVVKTFNDVTLILDLLHALEKLWKSAHALYREGSPEAQAFVYERAKRILEGQVVD